MGTNPGLGGARCAGRAAHLAPATLILVCLCCRYVPSASHSPRWGFPHPAQRGSWRQEAEGSVCRVWLPCAHPALPGGTLARALSLQRSGWSSCGTGAGYFPTAFLPGLSLAVSRCEWRRSALAAGHQEFNGAAPRLLAGAAADRCQPRRGPPAAVTALELHGGAWGWTWAGTCLSPSQTPAGQLNIAALPFPAAVSWRPYTLSFFTPVFSPWVEPPLGVLPAGGTTRAHQSPAAGRCREGISSSWQPSPRAAAANQARRWRFLLPEPSSPCRGAGM